MKKAKSYITRTANELAEFLGLPASEGLEIKIRSDLNDSDDLVVQVVLGGNFCGRESTVYQLSAS
jgi:hypothetical protein